MTDQGEPRRSASDPIAAGVEAVAAGYRTVEYVVEAFAESLRRRPETDFSGPASAFRREEGAAGSRARGRGEGRTTARGRAARGGRAGVSGNMPSDIADLTAELLDRFGETMHALAETVGERASFERAPECPSIRLEAVPGASAGVDFRFTNTGSSALTEVAFEVTHLIGAVDRIEADRVGIGRRGDQRFPRIRPGGSTVATVAVKVPEETPPGIYRGVIAARSAAPAGRRSTDVGPDAWALLELEVKPLDRRTAIVDEEPRADDERRADDEPREVS